MSAIETIHHVEQSGYDIPPGILKFMRDLETSNAQLSAAYVEQKDRADGLQTIVDDFMRTRVNDIASLMEIKRTVERQKQ